MPEPKKLTPQQLALYFGCDVQDFEGNKLIFEGIDSVLGEVNVRRHSENRGYWELLGNVKPILRPLSDMTDEEKVKCVEMCSLNYIFGTRRNIKANYVEIEADFINHLLSLRFDLFGWIEQGLAIDKTTLGK